MKKFQFIFIVLLVVSGLSLAFYIGQKSCQDSHVNNDHFYDSILVVNQYYENTIDSMQRDLDSTLKKLEEKPDEIEKIITRTIRIRDSILALPDNEQVRYLSEWLSKDTLFAE